MFCEQLFSITHSKASRVMDSSCCVAIPGKMRTDEVYAAAFGHCRHGGTSLAAVPARFLKLSLPSCVHCGEADLGDMAGCQSSADGRTTDEDDC